MSSIISCASQTHKKDKPNQDYCTSFTNPKLGIKGVIVADGLGSHLRSEISSNFCAEKLKEKLENVDNLQINYRKLFAEVKTELEIFAGTELNAEEKANTILGTTLICVVEFDSEYQIAYVGNGSIWQISGNFNHFNASRSLPWNSINLLNPHNIEEKGEPKMFKYISTADVSTIPSEIKLSKNEDSYGDIIVIASDGIYSNDEAKIGKDSKGINWVMGEDTMIELYKALNALFLNNPSEITESDLHFELEKYLTLLRERDFMDDDTTLGLIISNKVIQYQQQCWEERERLKVEAEKAKPITNTTDAITNKNSDEIGDETNTST
jgi:serine/threonine protein phosphatase PrpC